MDENQQTQDVLDLIDKFNILSEQAEYSLQIDIQAAGSTQVILNDGGIVGNTYTSSIPHNLGYAPMFLVYLKDDGINQYTILPTIPVLNGGGATIHYQAYAYADGTNVYAAVNFFAPTVSFGHTNNGPFYDPGTTFNFVYFILKNPIMSN